MLCPIKVNSNTIELTLHTSCYCVYTYSVMEWWATHCLSGALETCDIYVCQYLFAPRGIVKGP